MKLDQAIAIARHAVRLCGWNAGVILIMFFVMTALLLRSAPATLRPPRSWRCLGVVGAIVCWIFCGLL